MGVSWTFLGKKGRARLVRVSFLLLLFLKLLHLRMSKMPGCQILGESVLNPSHTFCQAKPFPSRSRPLRFLLPASRVHPSWITLWLHITIWHLSAQVSPWNTSMQKDYAQLTMITAAYVTLSAKLGLLIEHLRNGLVCTGHDQTAMHSTQPLSPRNSQFNWRQDPNLTFFVKRLSTTIKHKNVPNLVFFLFNFPLSSHDPSGLH